MSPVNFATLKHSKNKRNLEIELMKAPPKISNATKTAYRICGYNPALCTKRGRTG